MRRTQLITYIVLAMVMMTNVVVQGFSTLPTKSTTTDMFGIGGRQTKSQVTSTSKITTTTLAASRTIEAPVREKTDQDTGTKKRRQQNDDDGYDNTNDNDNNNYSDLEYFMDPSALRGDNDPFHILLLGSTFDKPKVTLQYVTNSLQFVLDMPYNEGIELSQFAKDEGMSCLGTWPQEQCINFGKQLQVRDIVCRVVPYCEGGQRGWQAKDSADTSRYDGASFS